MRLLGNAVTADNKSSRGAAPARHVNVRRETIAIRVQQHARVVWARQKETKNESAETCGSKGAKEHDIERRVGRKDPIFRRLLSSQS